MMTLVNDIDAIPAPTRLPAVIALAAAIAGPRRGRDRAAALALAGDALRACGPHARILVSGRGADNNGRDVDDKRRDVDDKRRDELVVLWDRGAPGAEQAEEACRAALAAVRAVRLSGLTRAGGRPLALRVGVATGTGPIRLAGPAGEGRQDAVAAATRLLAANARYGTAVIIAEDLRRLAGARIQVRELDRMGMAARGTSAGTIHELLRAAPERGAGPSWVALYEAGLAAYRGGDWVGALSLLQMLLAVRGHDRPAMLLIERCRRRLAATQGQPGGYTRRVSPP